MPTKKSIVTFKRKSFKRTAKKKLTAAPLKRKRTFRKRFMHRHRRHRRRGNSTNPSALTHQKIRRIGGADGGVDRMSVVLPYVYRATFTNVGAIADYNIKLNSIFDCGTGSDNDNAQGYLLYYNYFVRSRVHASSIQVFVNNSDGTTFMEPLQVVIIPCNASNLAIMNAGTDWMAMLNQAHAKTGVFYDGKGKNSVKHYCKVGTLAGYASLPLSSSIGAWGSTTGTDPTQLYSWYVGINNLSGTTSNDIQIEIRVKYYVDFTEPIYEADQELARRRTVDGNDFGGTKEEYAKYTASHAKPKIHNFKTKPVEEKKAQVLKAEEPQEFELIKVPKLKTPVPSSR